jgi:hypothetical protein
MKMCSTSPITREMQIDNEILSHTCFRIAITKKIRVEKDWKGCGEKDVIRAWNSCTIGGNVNCTAIMENSIEDSPPS